MTTQDNNSTVLIDLRPSWARGLLGFILISGAFIRGAYLLELQEHPDFQIPMLFQVDMGFIDNSALDYAQQARAFFHLPPIAPQFERPIVWRHNPGDPQLRPPAYTFFLATLYFLLGDHQFGVRWAQMSVGLCSVLLGYWLGRQLHGRMAGVIMAGLLAWYWPLIIYESVLHEPVLVVFISLLFLNVALWWKQKPGWKRAMVMGVCCGWYTTAAAAVLLFLPVLMAWTAGVCLFQKMQAQRARFTFVQTAIVFGSFFIPLLPVAALNYVESGQWVWNSAGQGITLHIGNQPGAKGYLMPADALLDEHLGLHDSDLRVDEKTARIESWDAWAALSREAAMKQICEHPRWFLRLCLRRAALFWTPHEISQNVTEYCDRLFSRVLSRLPGNFGVVFALLVAGVFFLGLYLLQGLFGRDRLSQDVKAANQRINGAGYGLVLLLIGTWYAPYLALWISAHFRVPILPALFAFVSFGVVQEWTHIKLKRRLLSAWVLLGTGMIMVVMSLIPKSYDEDVQTWLYYRVRHYSERNNLPQAIRIARHVTDCVPEHGFARKTLADLLFAAGRKAEAAVEYSRACNLLVSPEELNAMYENMGIIFRETGDPERAEAAFSLALRYQPGNARALHGLGNIAFEKGAYEEALGYLEQAAAQQPDHANTFFLIALTHLALQAPDKAEAAFRQGVAADPRDVWLRLGLADLLAANQQQTEACEHYRAALTIDPGNEKAYNALQSGCNEAAPMPDASGN